jgi:hypothetical protein
MVFFPDCSAVIQDALRLAVSLPRIIASTPRFSEVTLNTTGAIQSAPEFDNPGLLVQHLLHTPKGSQKQKCIMLMRMWVRSSNFSLDSDCIARIKFLGHWSYCIAVLLHQQQTEFPSGTHRCFWRPWWLWRNLVASDGESHATCCPRDGSHCRPSLRRLIYHAPYSCNASRCKLRSPPRRQGSFSLCRESGDVYTPSE